jgi:predicted RNA-binding Zn-ribbon protein involved in translation (DUF1610 family)
MNTPTQSMHQAIQRYANYKKKPFNYVGEQKYQAFDGETVYVSTKGAVYWCVTCKHGLIAKTTKSICDSCGNSLRLWCEQCRQGFSAKTKSHESKCKRNLQNLQQTQMVQAQQPQVPTVIQTTNQYGMLDPTVTLEESPYLDYIRRIEMPGSLSIIDICDLITKAYIHTWSDDGNDRYTLLAVNLRQYLLQLLQYFWYNYNNISFTPIHKGDEDLDIKELSKRLKCFNIFDTVAGQKNLKEEDREQKCEFIKQIIEEEAEFGTNETVIQTFVLRNTGNRPWTNMKLVPTSQEDFVKHISRVPSIHPDTDADIVIVVQTPNQPGKIVFDLELREGEITLGEFYFTLLAV